jgi:signal transduction histidine kinase
MVTQQPRTGTAPGHVLARGVLAWRDRYLTWIRRHPLLVDAALVAVLLWQSAPHVTGIRAGRQVLTLALVLGVVLPLVWRRRAPFLVFMIIAAMALVQLLTSRELTDDLALLVAFYTLCAYQPPRRILAAAVILEVGAAGAAAQTAPSGAHVARVWVFISGLVAGAGFLGYYVRTRRAYLASLVDRAERLERERDQEAQLAASAERTRIAREVHDIVAHNIAVMVALAEGAAYTVADSPGQAATIMGQVAATGRSALTEMRRMLGVMRQQGAPEHAPAPALADLDALLATVRAAGLPTVLTVTGQPFPLPPSAELALYRMIQEALTNTLKHAAATSAQVRLSYRPGAVGLEVTDDGQPGTAAAAAPGSAAGHGIAGMRERAAVFGAEVSAGPDPGGGWRVHAVLRLDPAPAGLGPAAGTPGDTMTEAP